MNCPDEHRIFVYGSLRPDIPNPMSERLASESTDLGPGTIDGALFNLGWYPGLVLDSEPGEKVQGRILCLKHPGSLEWLDDYEGCEPDHPETSLFLRERHFVEGEIGRLECWVYRYALPINDAERVHSGSWKDASLFDEEEDPDSDS